MSQWQYHGQDIKLSWSDADSDILRGGGQGTQGHHAQGEDQAQSPVGSVPSDALSASRVPLLESSQNILKFKIFS